MVRFIDESVARVHTLMAELVSPEFVFIFMSDNVSRVVCAAVHASSQRKNRLSSDQNLILQPSSFVRFPVV